MNSREKQRQALHANSSIAAKVRQLPLYMKVINVALAIILAFGVCTNWSFAAEVLHIQVANASETDQSYAEDSRTMEHGDTLQLSGLSPDGASSYEWQIFSEAENNYLPIVGQTEKDLTVDAGLLENQLNADNTAKLQCLTYDANEEIIAKYICTVTLNALIATVDNGLAGNGPDAETLELNGDANDIEENGQNVHIYVHFVDRNGAKVSEPLDQVLAVPESGNSSWLIKVNLNLGSIWNITKDITGTYAQYFDAHEVTGYEGYQNCVSCVVMPGLRSWEGTDINVTVTLNRTDYDYTIIADYPGFKEADPHTQITINRKAPLTTSIPTDADLQYLKNGCPDEAQAQGAGWTVEKYTGALVQTNKVTVTVYMTRTYTVLSFNADGGVNGPASVYMMNGQSYSEIAAWDRGGGKFYPQNSDFYRAQYVLDYWYYLDNGVEVPYPEKTAEANWGNYKAPGEARTFIAKWKFASTDPNAHYRVSLAYYVEKADSTEKTTDPVNPANYEYETTRYDKVYQPTHSGGQKVGTAYTLPQSGTAMNDRRYPQVVSSSDPEGIEVTSTISDIPNSKDQKKDSYKYNELYTFKASDSGVITKADGTTVIKIFLQRQTRTITFSWTNYYEAYQSWGSWRWRSTSASKTITAKWDADIKQQFLDLNKQASKEEDRPSSHNPADKKSSDYITWSPEYQVWCLYIQNMYKYNYSYEYDATASGEDHIRYYGHKIDAPYGHEGGSSDNYGFHYKAEDTDYADNWESIADIPNEGAQTNEEEFIPILGYKTPVQGVDGPKYQTSFHDDDNPGLSYYYYRNEFNIILKNLHGIDDIDTDGKMFHYDGVANIGRAYKAQSQDTITTYQYEKTPIGQIPFVAKEKMEKSPYSYSDGISGMEQGMVLGSTSNAEQFIPTTPPNSVDQHFVFGGWYADPDFSEASKIDVDTYAVPNHEIVLYAKWVTVERPLRYVTRDPKTEAETYGDVVQENYLENITHEAPAPSTTEGYKFLGWYYLTDPTQPDTDANRTWFNPDEMTMPWVDNMETYDGDGQEALTLHQLYSKVDYTDYRFDFKLWENGAATDILVSDSVYGSGHVGDQPEYTVLERVVDSGVVTQEAVPQLYEAYDYVYKLKDAFDPDHKKTYQFDTPLVFDSSDNVFTIYFVYDESKGFRYRTEDWLVWGESNVEVAMLDSDPNTGNRKVEAGWKNNLGNSIVTIPADPDKYKDQGYSLASPYSQTYQLQSDKNWDPNAGGHDGSLYPLDNIVKIYYKVGNSVDFNFSAVTYTDSSHETTMDAEGGSVDPTSITNVSISSASNYISTAKANPGYKFIGWYDSKYEGGKYIPDFNKQLTTNLQVNTKDYKEFDVYTGNLNYIAVFERVTESSVALNYKVMVYDAFGNVYAASADSVNLIFDGSGSASQTLTDNLTPLGHFSSGTYTDAYDVKINAQLPWAPFKGWYKADSSGNPGTKITEGVSSEGTLTPPKQTYGSGSGAYQYYENATYICVFDERELPDSEMVKLTYTVNPVTYGQVAFNYTGAPWTTDTSASIVETVYPHSGNINISGASSDTPKVYGAKEQTYNGTNIYKFKEWTYTGATSPVVSDSVITPQREGTGDAAVYKTSTYTANFEDNTHTVKFMVDANGTINPNLDSLTVYDGATYTFSVNEQAMKMNSVVTSGSVTKTPVPDTGYGLDKTHTYAWYIRTGTEDPYTDTPLSGDFKITADTTFVVKFAPAPDITLTYRVAPYGERGQQGYSETPGSITKLAATEVTAVSVEDTIAPVKYGASEGWATDMRANANTGYKFAYWTVDEGTTQFRDVNPYAYPTKTGTHVGGGTYLYYDGSHTLWAHYELVNTIKVSVIVNSAQTTLGEITGTATSTGITAFTPYKAKYVAGATDSDPSYGEFYLDSTLTATASGISGSGYEFAFWQYYYDSQAAQGYKELDDSVVINQDITFVANFQKQGNVPYDVNYLYETVEHAKWRAAGSGGSEPLPAYKSRSNLDKTDPAYNDTDSPSFSGKADGASQIYVNKSTVIGFTTERVTVAEGGGTYVEATRLWTIGSGQQTLNVEMDRNLQFDYRVSYWAETADSALSHPGTTDFRIDNTYEDTWDMRDEYPNPMDGKEKVPPEATQDCNEIPLKGIYGDTVYIWENPWGTTDTEFVKTWPCSYNNDGTKKITSHLKYEGKYNEDGLLYEVVQSTTPVDCTEYIIGSNHSFKEDGTLGDTDLPAGWTYNKNTDTIAYCNIYQARNQNYPYAIKYYRQKIDPETGITSENELVAVVTAENAQVASGSSKFTDVDANAVKLTTDAGALKDEFNPLKWGTSAYSDENITLYNKFDSEHPDVGKITPTGFTGKTFAELFNGYEYYGNDQQDSTLINYSRNATTVDNVINWGGKNYVQTRAVANVYFAATETNHYTIHYHKETTEHAQWRYTGSTDAEPSPGYTEVTADKTNVYTATNGEFVNLETSAYKDKYNADGYTWATSTTYPSTKSLLVKPDPTTSGDSTVNVANIYYNADFDTKFTVEYYTQNVSGGVPGSDYTKDDTKQYEGITDAYVYVTNKMGDQPVGSPEVRQNDKYTKMGFALAYATADNTTTHVDQAKMYNGQTIKIYYNRKAESVDWTIEYYLQDIDGQAPLTTYTQLKDEDGYPVITQGSPKGTVGCESDFSKYLKNGTDYKTITGFDQASVKVNEGAGDITPTGNKVVTNVDANGNGISVVKLYYNRQSNWKYNIKYYKEKLKADGTPSGQFDDGTLVEEDVQNYYGATIAISYNIPKGYKALSQNQRFMPTSGTIKVGDTTSYGGVDDAQTTGRAFFGIDNKSQYTVVVHRETEDSAIDRRDNPTTHLRINDEFDNEALTKLYTDYPTKEITVSSIINRINTEEASYLSGYVTDGEFGCAYSNPDVTSDPNAKITVNADGTVKVDLYYYRQIDHHAHITLKFESVTHAKTSQGEQWDETLTKEIEWENGVTGETVDLSTIAWTIEGTPEGTLVGDAGFEFSTTSLAPSHEFSYPKTGEVSATVFFKRLPGWYRVGYRLETVDYARYRTGVTAEEPAKQYDVYKPTGAEGDDGWVYYQDVFGYSIDRNAEANGTKLLLQITGFEIDKVEPGSFEISKMKKEDVGEESTLIFYYNRISNAKYKLNIVRQENMESPYVPVPWIPVGSYTLNAIFGDTVDMTNADIREAYDQGMNTNGYTCIPWNEDDTSKYPNNERAWLAPYAGIASIDMSGTQEITVRYSLTTEMKYTLQLQVETVAHAKWRENGSTGTEPTPWYKAELDDGSELSPSEISNGYVGQVINKDTSTVKVLTQTQYEGFTYVHCSSQDGIWEAGKESITIPESQQPGETGPTLYIQFNRDIYTPDPPTTAAFQGRYYKETLAHAKWRITHVGQEPTGDAAWTLADTGYFGGVYYDEVTYTNPTNLIKTYTGYTHNKKLTSWYDGATTKYDPDGNQFSMHINDKHDQYVNLYYELNYYESNGFDANYYVETIEHARYRLGWTTVAPATDYVKESSISPTHFAAFYDETVDLNWADLNDKPLMQTIAGYTCVEALTKWPDASVGADKSFKVDTTHNQAVTLYYNCNSLIPPTPPTPEGSAFTVRYKVQKLESAKKGQTAEADYDILTNADGTDVVDYIRGIYGDKVTDAYVTDFTTTPNKMLKDFKIDGFYYANKYWDNVSQSYNKGFDIALNGQQQIILYYNREYYDPDGPDDPPVVKATGFQATYMVETEQHAEWRMNKGAAADEPEYYEEYKTPTYAQGFSPKKFAAWYDEPVDINWKDADGFALCQNITGFKFMPDKTDWGTTGASEGKFYVNNSHNQAMTLYYDRKIYDPDPDDPTDPTVDKRAGYDVTFMVETVDYCLGLSDVRWEQRHYVAHEAVFGQKIANTSEVIAADKTEFEADPGNLGGFTYLEIKPVGEFEVTDQFSTSPHFVLYYTRNITNAPSYNVIKMVKNVDFVTGIDPDPAHEYIQYGETAEYKAYFEEIIDATRSDLWQEIPEYTFENRCVPEMLQPWTAEDEPVLANVVVNDDDNTITGYYDLTTYPEPEHVNVQTGDNFGAFAIGLSIAGLMALGLFLALSRRKKVSGRHCA